MSLSLSASQKKAFRARGHQLEPVVIVGKDNVTEAVLKAIDAALTTHELIKVKLLNSATVDKSEAADEICVATEATLVQRVGRVALLYRPRPDEDEAGS
jgi:RNA-binding protein